MTAKELIDRRMRLAKTLCPRKAAWSAKRLLLVAVLAILGALTGCGDAHLPILTSIQVTPGSATVPAGLSQRFTATGTFSDGTSRDLTTFVTWSSSNTTVGVIGASTGLAVSQSQGSSTITAAFNAVTGTVTGTAALNVGPAALTSVVVSDASAVVPGPNSVGTVNIAVGTSHQFFAYGIYSDGGERDITTSVTWSSAPVAVATINNVGRAMGVTVGTSTITATDPTTSFSGSATLHVTSATISGIVIAPTTQTIAPHTRLQFTAIGEFSDGTTQNITSDASWSSSQPAVATISNTVPNGLATGVAAGSTTIHATLSSVTGSAPLTVSSATLSSIALTPASSGVAVGSTLQLEAVGMFSDGTTQPLNLAVTWSVTPSDGSVATVTQTGLVTGVAAGAATVTAQLGAVTRTAALTVESLTSLAITPATATVAQGTQTQFAAIATLADGSTQDVSSSVTWISTAPAVATVSDVFGWAGWASGISPGTSTIGAVFGGVLATTQLTVTNATLTGVAITPSGGQNIALGTGQQYQATGTFTDSSTQNLTNQATWTSSAPAVAIVNGSGLATSTGVGTTMVKAAATINGVTASDTQVLTVH